MNNVEINKSDEKSTAFDKFIKVFRNGERNEVKNMILRLPSEQWAEGKQKCGEFASVECAPLQVANLPQRNTHTDWRRRERFFSL
jgi:hypothetical protein